MKTGFGFVVLDSADLAAVFGSVPIQQNPLPLPSLVVLPCLESLPCLEHLFPNFAAGFGLELEPELELAPGHEPGLVLPEQPGRLVVPLLVVRQPGPGWQGYLPLVVFLVAFVDCSGLEGD